MSALGIGLALLLGASQAGGPSASGPQVDTVVLGAAEALQRALDVSPSTRGAQWRADAAEARLAQARAWQNPVLSVTAENLGATEPISGVQGIRGVEGQAVLGGWIPVGGDRSALRSLADAHLLEARSISSATEADVRFSVIEALAVHRRDQARLGRASEEAAGLTALASALAAQAASGRASQGETARAHLAMVSALASEAEAVALAAASAEALGAVLGLAPGTAVVVDVPACVPPAPPGSPGGVSPLLVAARARSSAAQATLAESRARRIPDLLPQIGIRRAGGISAFYAGVSISLPLFDRGSASVQSALRDGEAAAADAARVERDLAAQREAALRGLTALEATGRHYGPEWVDALEQAVTAAEARYRLGEGTLTELLDGRRARLQALDDYERWRAAVLVERARLARLDGSTIDSTLLCEGTAGTIPTPDSEGRP